VCVDSSSSRQLNAMALSSGTLLQTTRPAPLADIASESAAFSEVASARPSLKLLRGVDSSSGRQLHVMALSSGTLLQTTRPAPLAVIASESAAFSEVASVCRQQLRSAAQCDGTVKWYIASDYAACTTC
jgi:hypothetical protein